MCMFVYVCVYITYNFTRLVTNTPSLPKSHRHMFSSHLAVFPAFSSICLSNFLILLFLELCDISVLKTNY